MEKKKREEKKKAPNWLEKLEQKFPAVLPEIVTFLDLETALKLLQTDKNYAQRAAHLFQRFGEFTFTQEHELVTEQFTRWMFRTNKILPNVRILSYERLEDISNERFQDISKCTKLKVLRMNIVSRLGDVFDRLPPFPSTLQKLNVDVSNATGHSISANVDSMLKRAFLEKPTTFSELVFVRWTVGQDRSIPTENFISWVQLVPALQTLVMTVDWVRTGVLRAICHANLTQLTKLHLNVNTLVKLDGKTFENEDEIHTLSKLPKLDSLWLETSKYWSFARIEWKYEKLEGKCYFEHDNNMDTPEASMQLVNDQLAFLKRAKIHWDSVVLWCEDTGLNTFLQKLLQVCFDYEATIDSIELTMDGSARYVEEDLYRSVLEFMSNIHCHTMTVKGYAETWTFEILDQKQKTLNVVMLDGSPLRGLRALGYNIQQLSMITNDDDPSNFQDELKLLQNQDQPLEILDASNMREPINVLNVLKQLGLAKSLKSLSLNNWDPNNDLETALGRSFPSLIALYVQFDQDQRTWQVRKAVFDMSKWIQRLSRWKLTDTNGVILAQSAPLETKTLTKKEATAGGGAWVQFLKQSPKIEQAFEEFFNERIQAEIQADVAQLFPPPLNLHERQLAFRIAQASTTEKVDQLLGGSSSLPSVKQLVSKLF